MMPHRLLPYQFRVERIFRRPLVMGEDTRQHVVKGQLFSNIAGMGMNHFPMRKRRVEPIWSLCHLGQ